MATAVEHPVPLNTPSEAPSAGAGVEEQEPAGNGGLEAGGESHDKAEKEEVEAAKFKVGQLPLCFNKNTLFLAKILKSRYSLHISAACAPSFGCTSSAGGIKVPSFANEAAVASERTKRDRHPPAIHRTAAGCRTGLPFPPPKNTSSATGAGLCGRDGLTDAGRGGADSRRVKTDGSGGSTWCTIRGGTRRVTSGQVPFLS